MFKEHIPLFFCKRNFQVHWYFTEGVTTLEPQCKEPLQISDGIPQSLMPSFHPFKIYWINSDYCLCHLNLSTLTGIIIPIYMKTDCLRTVTVTTLVVKTGDTQA